MIGFQGPIFPKINPFLIFFQVEQFFLCITVRLLWVAYCVITVYIIRMVLFMTDFKTVV